MRGGVIQHAAARWDRQRMAVQGDGQRRQGVLERAVGLDCHRATGDPFEVGEIAAKEVQWVKTADRSALGARRRQQFHRRGAAAMHERFGVWAARRIGLEAQCVCCRTDAVIGNG